MSSDDPFAERKLIISVPEARKIMGKDANGLSDAQVEKLIVDFTAISKLYFKELSSNDVSARKPPCRP